MEGLRKRIIIMAVFFMAVGAFILLTPKVASAQRTEEWLESKAPVQVGDFQMLQNPKDPQSTVTYRMDEMTYDELKPFGIVARVFEHDRKRFDVVLIASADRTSFHDPRVCFRGQGFLLEKEREEVVQTKTRGTIPVTFAEMKNPQGTQSIAAFFYRDQDGFYPNPQAMSMAWLKRAFFKLQSSEGVFYRFIPMHDGATVEELKRFIQLYMDEAPNVSGGYF